MVNNQEQHIIDSTDQYKVAEKKKFFLLEINTIIEILILVICLFVIYYLINFIQYQQKAIPVWKQKHPLLQFQNFSTEQRIYYKIFLKIIKEDCPTMPEDEIDLLATLLVTSSKYIPYFAGIVYTESFLPGRWRRGKFIPPQKWHNFSQKDDGGSPSYGRVKIKMNTIRAVCSAIGEKPPKSGREININDPEWQIKLFRWAGWHFDNMVRRYKGDVFRAISVYKFGPRGYKKWKKRNPKQEPFEVSGIAIQKACEYLQYFANYCLKGENDFK